LETWSRSDERSKRDVEGARFARGAISGGGSIARAVGMQGGVCVGVIIVEIVRLSWWVAWLLKWLLILFLWLQFLMAGG